MNQQKTKLIAAPAEVALRAFVYFTRRQRMDVHNAVETVLDALQQVVYDNDKQVVGLFTPPQRLIDDERPRVELEVQHGVEAQFDVRWRSE